MDVISYTLSKKYTDEKCKDMEDKRQQDKLKVTKVEKELNDFKNTLHQVNVNQEAKQSTSGYGIVSLPKNAANGQVSVIVKGNTETDEEGNTKSTIAAMKIKSVGKNLFDGGTIRPYKQTDNVKWNNGVLEYKRIHPSAYSGALVKVKLEKGCTYRLNYVDNPVDGAYYKQLLNSNLKFVSWLHGKTTFTATEENMYILFTRATPDSSSGVTLSNIQLEKGDTTTEYESYKESTAYVVAKKDNKIVNLMSHEGAHDEIDLDKGVLIKRVGVDETGLTYQLAEPEIIPVEVSGNIVSNPSGTIYIEPAVADANVYNDGITIFEQELNIDYIDKLSKIDYKTGVETELDASKCIISEDNKSFTHPDLQNGDMVFFEYYYSNETTQGEATVEYYDSRYVIPDKTLPDKYYKWNIEVDNGVPNVIVTEV